MLTEEGLPQILFSIESRNGFQLFLPVLVNTVSVVVFDIYVDWIL